MGRSLLNAVKQLHRWAEARAGWLLTGGLLAALGYNCLRWRADRRRLCELRAMDMPPLPEIDPAVAPRVSILLPAWNEADNLDACMTSLLALRYPNKEIILCAGGQDATLDIAMRYAGPNIVVLEQRPGEGKQGALRRSFAQSTGKVIFLTDADCVLKDEALECTLGPILSGEEVATTGAWRPFEWQEHIPLVQHQWVHHVYRELWMPDYAPTLGPNAAVRYEALKAVRAFEIPAPIGTDVALSHQLTEAGYRIRFVRGSRVWTEYPDTLEVYRKQLSRWFRNPLVHERHWLMAPLARSHVRAGSAAIFLLMAPLAATVSGLVRAAWGSIVAHLLLSELRTYVVFSRSRIYELTTIHYLTQLPYQLVSWWTMARETIALVTSRTRLDW